MVQCASLKNVECCWILVEPIFNTCWLVIFGYEHHWQL